MPENITHPGGNAVLLPPGVSLQQHLAISGTAGEGKTHLMRSLVETQAFGPAARIHLVTEPGRSKEYADLFPLLAFHGEGLEGLLAALGAANQVMELRTECWRDNLVFGETIKVPVDIRGGATEPAVPHVVMVDYAPILENPRDTQHRMASVARAIIELILARGRSLNVTLVGGVYRPESTMYSLQRGAQWVQVKYDRDEQHGEVTKMVDTATW